MHSAIRAWVGEKVSPAVAEVRQDTTGQDKIDSTFSGGLCTNKIVRQIRLTCVEFWTSSPVQVYYTKEARIFFSCAAFLLCDFLFSGATAERIRDSIYTIPASFPVCLRISSRVSVSYDLLMFLTSYVVLVAVRFDHSLSASSTGAP